MSNNNINDISKIFTNGSTYKSKPEIQARLANILQLHKYATIVMKDFSVSKSQKLNHINFTNKIKFYTYLLASKSILVKPVLNINSEWIQL